MLVARDELVEAGEHVVQGHRGLHRVQPERRYGLQRHARDHTQCAQPDARGIEDLGALGRRARHERPVGQHDLDPPHLCGEPLVGHTGAVGAGRDRPGDGLRVDVTEVRQGEPALPQQQVEPAQRHPGGGGDQSRRCDDAQQFRVRGRAQRHILGHGDPGEGVSRAERLDPQAVASGDLHRIDDLVRVPRDDRPPRVGALVARPVAPGHAISMGSGRADPMPAVPSRSRRRSAATYQIPASASAPITT
jgi:hypothetical protein